jgi:hypothetical protein
MTTDQPTMTEPTATEMPSCATIGAYEGAGDRPADEIEQRMYYKAMGHFLGAFSQREKTPAGDASSPSDATETG